MSETPKRQCHYWAKQGTCAQGDKCGFAHTSKSGEQRCRFWARGACGNGDHCGFAHTGKAGDHVECRHYAKGFCKRGVSCNFKHTPWVANWQNPWQHHWFLPQAPPVTIDRVTIDRMQHLRTQPKRDALCRHFAKGYCVLEDACRFTHQTVNAGQ